MKFATIKSIYKKEILDLLRDKKTLIMMVLVPLLLYPLIMIAALFIASSVASGIQSDTYHIAIVKGTGADETEIENLAAFLEESDDTLDGRLEIVQTDDPLATLSDKTISAYIEVKKADGLAQPEYIVHYRSSGSGVATDLIETKLELYQEKLERDALTKLSLDADAIMEPFSVSWEDESSSEETLGNILGSILPFLLITSILMGAVYPAIDTTAGEKERGTLETLLTLPVRNDELIMGKFLAVSTVSIVSALLNLISMGFVGTYIYQVMLVSTDSTGFDWSGFPSAIFVVILCMITFSLFISALTMCVTIFAKSFKEANNYVTPLLLVVMLTGYIGFLPNMELNATMASIPVVNICLLIKDILLLKFDFALIFIVLVTNIVYAALAILILSRLYDSEDILFSDGGVNLQIFTKRSEIKPGDMPNVSDAILVAAVSMLLLLYVGSVLQMKFLLTGLFATQLFIIGVPLLAAWYTKRNLKETFSLKLPHIKDFFGAILLETGIFLILIPLSLLLAKIFPQSMEQLNNGFRAMLSDVPFAAVFFVIAVAPAVCEEMLFRGYLFSALRKKIRPIWAILLIAALFGIYHMSFLKFFTTGLLGLALCYVTYKSNSIFPAMLMHFLNNAISAVGMYYPEQLEKFLPAIFSDTASSSEALMLFAAGALSAALGIFIVSLKKKKQ